MALFSRRDLQTSVDTLSGHLTQTQLQAMVHRLNRGPSGLLLATEWEVSLLSAFSQCGKIEYEKDFGGKRHPDLLFQSGDSGKFEFLADITTISDVYAHEQNPYDDFCAEIRIFLQKHGHISGGLRIDVQHEMHGAYGNRKVRLLLPQKAQVQEFVKAKLGTFLALLVKEPDSDHGLFYNQSGIRFTIHYDSREKRFDGGSHFDYTVPYSKRRNPLRNALWNKAIQLLESGYTGSTGVIVCVGGCDALNERSGANGAYGCHQIIEEVFRSTLPILFVLVLRVQESRPNFPSDSSVKIVPKLYWKTGWEKAQVSTALSAIERMSQLLPAPEDTPMNAIHSLKGSNGHIGRPLGGFSMQGGTIKISARALTQLLAGEIELKRFLQQHGLKSLTAREPTFAFFEQQLKRGHTLRKAFVEPDEHKDDDWIVLEYAGPDSAISPYLVPK